MFLNNMIRQEFIDPNLLENILALIFNHVLLQTTLHKIIVTFSDNVKRHRIMRMANMRQ